MKIASRAGIVAAVAGSFALSLVVAGLANAAQASDWELQLSLADRGESRFVDVDASGADSAWAVGWDGVFPEATPFAFRYDGTAWTEVPNPLRDGYEFTNVDTTSTGSAWATAGDQRDLDAGDDLVLQWDGDGWTQHETAGSIGGDVAAVADDDVWFAAGVAGGGAVAQHWDGSQWTTTKLPGRPEGISTVDARSTDDVWVAGRRRDQPYAAHWNGESWQGMSPPKVTPPGGAEEFSASLHGLVSVSADEVWAVGSATWDDGSRRLVYRFDGTKWRKVAGPDFGNREGSLTNVGIGADGAVWLVPSGWNFLFKRVGDGWEEITLPEEDGTATSLTAVAAAGGQMWATGLAEVSDVEFHGLIYHSEGT